MKVASRYLIHLEIFLCLNLVAWWLAGCAPPHMDCKAMGER